VGGESQTSLELALALSEVRLRIRGRSTPIGQLRLSHGRQATATLGYVDEQRVVAATRQERDGTVTVEVPAGPSPVRLDLTCQAPFLQRATVVAGGVRSGWLAAEADVLVVDLPDTPAEIVAVFADLHPWLRQASVVPLMILGRRPTTVSDSWVRATARAIAQDPRAAGPLTSIVIAGSADRGAWDAMLSPVLGRSRDVRASSGLALVERALEPRRGLDAALRREARGRVTELYRNWPVLTELTLLRRESLGLVPLPPDLRLDLRRMLRGVPEGMAPEVIVSGAPGPPAGVDAWRQLHATQSNAVVREAADVMIAAYERTAT
jgi:hypothetical protein